MIGKKERLVLIDFLLYHINEQDEDQFEVVDFTKAGKLVLSCEDGQHMLFDNLDTFLEMLKSAFNADPMEFAQVTLPNGY